MLRGAAFLLVVLALGVLAVAPRASAGSPAIAGYPDSIASTGDSITRAANSAGIGDAVENSWATGTNASVDSVYSRILAQNPAISGNRFNDAVSGARMTHLDGQVAQAVTQSPELVTILIGANDVCASGEAAMTSVATFRSQFEAAMATVTGGLPDARIAVASIPEIHNLWFILKDDATAVSRWGQFSICQAMLLNPQSTAPADVTRRANVRQRNIDFNTQLAEVCAQYVHCKYDGGAAFNLAFQPQHVSTLDYFHPSVAGQALAATVGWEIYDFTDAQPPFTSRTMTPVGGGTQVTLSASDNAGLSGIEYKVNAGTYQKYTGAVTVPTADTLTYRAVDINGNTEATRIFKVCEPTPWAVPPGDGDCDAFSDMSEDFAGTDSALACASTAAPDDEPAPDAWPYDFNDDQLADLSDVLRYNTPGVFGSATPGPPYDARYDLSGDGSVDLSDVLLYNTPGVFGASCAP